MQKIALINCFFGPLPWYFDFFLKSCCTNETVDFIIFSDSSYNKRLPENVKIVSFNLNDFNQLATQKLNMSIDVKTPYKLCDFKPAYGVIFSEYLRNYDFWGMCDIDVILGNIRSFMTTEILQEYDVISTRHDFVTGWFMLFRNKPEINDLFKKSKDYAKVFTSEIHYCFDECNFKYLQLDDEVSNILDIDCEIESMEHVVRKEMNLNRIKVYYDLIMVDGLSGKIKWDHGTLSYDSEFEVLLYHLIRYKANQYTQKTAWETIPDVFYVDKYCFRRNGMKTFSGLFKSLYFNKLKVQALKVSNVFKFFISNLFAAKNSPDFQNAIYKNQQGDDCFNILDNQIFFETSKHKGDKLVHSKFEKNTVYLRNHPLASLRYSKGQNNEISKIQLMQIDGGWVHYELKAETSELAN